MRTTVRPASNLAVSVGPIGLFLLSPFLLLYVIGVVYIFIVVAAVRVCVALAHTLIAGIKWLYHEWRDAEDPLHDNPEWAARHEFEHRYGNHS